jgi:hypothetical protein
MAADKGSAKELKSKATPGKMVKNVDKDKPSASKVVGQGVADTSKGTTPEVSLHDVMGAIMDIKRVQTDQNSKLSDLTDRLSIVEQGPEDFMEYEDYSNYEYGQENVEDHTSVRATTSVEPSLKKQKCQSDEVVENSGDATGNVDTPSPFKVVGEKMRKAEKVGDNVHADLASNINELFRAGMGDEVFKAMVKEIARPDNCVGLTEVRTNPLMWKLLSDRAQGIDSRLRIVQVSMCKAASVLALLLDEVHTLQTDSPTELGEKFIEKGMEAVGLLGHANASLNFRRREIMKPEIDRDYGFLCSPNTKFTEWLFGDDVSGDLKEIQAVNKVQTRLRGRGRGGFSAPYRGRGQFRGRGSIYGSYPNYQGRGRFQGGWQPRRGRGQQRQK